MSDERYAAGARESFSSFPSLYAILDPSLSSIPVVQLATVLADAGVRLMQLRDKGLGVGGADGPGALAATGRVNGRRLLATARELIAKTSDRGVKLIVNDRPDIAAIAGAAGVHVGQDDLPVEDARRICGTHCWVGVSTHNMQQLREAASSSADYIAVGPIFPTSSKENPDPVVGLEFLRAARQITQKPLVAIGGITRATAAEVWRAGADSLAMIRDISMAPDPASVAAEYLAIAAQLRD
jgi:thiamine-phosphate pyrophosphorylase